MKNDEQYAKGLGQAKGVPTNDTTNELRLEKGAVVYMKPDSGLIGFGNEQCVSWYSPEIDELSLYGHNEHYHGYQVNKIISTPSTLLAAQRQRWEAETTQILDRLTIQATETKDVKTGAIRQTVGLGYILNERRNLTALDGELGKEQ